MATETIVITIYVNYRYNMLFKRTIVIPLGLLWESVHMRVMLHKASPVVDIIINKSYSVSNRCVSEVLSQTLDFLLS